MLRRVVVGEANAVCVVIGVVRTSGMTTADAFDFGNRMATLTTGNCPAKPSTTVPVMPAATADRVDQQRQRGQTGRDNSEHARCHRQFGEPE